MIHFYFDSLTGILSKISDLWARSDLWSLISDLWSDLWSEKISAWLEKITENTDQTENSDQTEKIRSDWKTQGALGITRSTKVHFGRRM